MTTSAQIMASIKNQWDIFEAFLLYPTKDSEFDAFLKNYRGMAHSNSGFSFKRGELAEGSAQGAINFFVNIFALCGLADLDSQNIEKILGDIEKNVNLLLYYWFGLNDRNYQFRTWIHFFGLEGIKSIFLTKEHKNFSVTLSESGIQFGVYEEFRIPKMLPISKILLDSAFLQASQNPNSQRVTFARLRSIQREICLLIDEWEYQNSILAVEYGQALQFLHANKNAHAEELHKNILRKLDLKRNFYASFSLQAFCDFQEWINKVDHENSNTDVTAEIDALCALMLSAMQKFFLPASISRLVYENEVIALVQRFFVARLVYCPEDFSAKLCLQAAQSALGLDFNANLLEILTSKPYEWKLCFDPSAGLKAFCWAYSRQVHVTLSTLMGICYFKKCYANHLDAYQFSDLIVTYQTQDSFFNYLKKGSVYENSIALLPSDFDNLKSALQNYLETHLKQSKSLEDDLNMIKSYLDQLHVVGE